MKAWFIKTADTDVDRLDLALLEGEELDVPVVETLVDARHVLLVAGDAVEGLGVDAVERAAFGVV